jgi:hypothetical protein
MTNHSLEPIRPMEPETEKRMTNAEAVLLCRYAKAACPQQQFDAYTPDAWYDLLGDMRFEDCKAALTAIVKRQPFVAPAEIRDEVKRVRNKRISEFGPIPEPPPEIGQDPEKYHHWLTGLMRAIGDGTVTRETYADPVVAVEPTPEQRRALRELIGKYRKEDQGEDVLPTPDDDTDRTETDHEETPT